jgi:hypothetical protein
VAIPTVRIGIRSLLSAEDSFCKEFSNLRSEASNFVKKKHIFFYLDQEYCQYNINSTTMVNLHAGGNGSHCFLNTCQDIHEDIQFLTKETKEYQIPDSVWICLYSILGT